MKIVQIFLCSLGIQVLTLFSLTSAREFCEIDLNIQEPNARKFDQIIGGPVDNPADLACDFEGDCCWKADQDNSPFLEFVRASGDAENCIDGARPKGKFLFVKSSKNQKGKALLESCSILCTESDINVKIKHWKSKGVKVEACLRQSFSSSAGTKKCQPVGSNGMVTLPKSEVHSVVLKVSNFKKYDSLVIDDIEVDFVPCGGDAGGGSAGQDQSGVCAFACSMTEQNLCNWQGTSTRQWKAYSKGIVVGNLDTGVNAKLYGGNVQSPQVSESGFAGVALSQNEEASMFATGPPLEEDYDMTFRAYEACVDNFIQICTDDICSVITDPQITASDRQWKQYTTKIRKGTQKIEIKATNQGQYYCAAGISHLTFQKDGTVACTAPASGSGSGSGAPFSSPSASSSTGGFSAPSSSSSGGSGGFSAPLASSPVANGPVIVGASNTGGNGFSTFGRRR